MGELLVDWRADRGFVYVEADLSDRGLEDLLGGHRLEPGQIADLSPAWRPLYRDLARSLRRGLLITCDYGYRARAPARRARAPPRHARLLLAPPREPRRARSTSASATSPRTSTSPRCARRARPRASTRVAFTRQAPWLVAAGIFDEIAATGAPASAQARMLLDGEGMGEEIRVLVQSKGLSAKDLLDASNVVESPPAGRVDSLGAKDRMTDAARGERSAVVSRLLQSFPMRCH